MPETRTRGTVTRVVLWICGAFVALAATLWAVTAAADPALSAGVYGTPGTYQGDSCYDVGNSRENSEISCYGDFVPDNGGAADAVYVRLEDTGHDYPDGYEFDARQGIEPETVQRAGIRGVVGELRQVGFAVVALCWLAYLAINPPTVPDLRRCPAPRQSTPFPRRIVECLAILEPVGKRS